MKPTHNSLQQYMGKWVNIKTDYAVYPNEQIVRIEGDSLITEYHHWLKTPEDGLLRDHWIDISRIELIEIA